LEFIFEDDVMDVPGEDKTERGLLGGSFVGDPTADSLTAFKKENDDELLVDVQLEISDEKSNDAN
jgi:hypothetical protein